MKIQVLASHVIDQIAAGEVLERPANLVKELVENSLDAQASQIDVTFEAGGRQLLVIDNGLGMTHEDLQLAIHRHATSKITHSEDLFKLNSFGFRGEALASVAAVSQLTLTARARGSDQGYRLQNHFGQAGSPAPLSALEGCEVRVTELFGNVPARLKFLKSDAAENGQIKNTLKALALAHESVGFSVRSKGELLFHWPAQQSFKARGQLVLENSELFEGVYECDGLRAEVLVSSPKNVGKLNRNMWFFVQNRWVQDRSLGAAVMEAYRNLLMHGEYPAAVVRLFLSPEDVDVNVHPAKSQVKFRDPQLAFRVTCRAVRAVLEKSPWLKQQEDFVPAVRAAAPATPTDSDNFKFEGREFERTQYATKSFAVAQVREVLEPVRGTLEVFRWGDLQVIGQLNHTYIVAQTAEALYLVDQHAAHERVVFERLMESFKNGNIEVQNLLMPLVFDFPREEIETLLAHREAISKLGVSLEQMGPESIAVQAIPVIVKEAAVSEALHKLAYEMANSIGELAWEKAVGDILASMACHSVVRAGQALSAGEMQSLLQQMDQYPLSSFCPHGRPVFSKRRLADIDREFGRIV